MERTLAATAGGLGMSAAEGGAIYALYTSMAYMAAVPGGWVADRLIGQRRAVFWGGVIIAAGHFTAANQLEILTTHFLNMVAITVGFLAGWCLTGQVESGAAIRAGRNVFESQAANITQVFEIFLFLVRDFESQQVDVVFKRERAARPSEDGMGTFRIEVGHAHGVKPGNIVGAIANEAGIDSKYIGRIEIYDDYSKLDLPADLPPDLMEHLKSVWVAGQQLNITRDGEAPAPGKKGAFSAPKKAGDRRFAEKSAAPKPGPKKEHRKGPKSA